MKANKKSTQRVYGRNGGGVVLFTANISEGADVHVFFTKIDAANIECRKTSYYECHYTVVIVFT
jgi:hypothetical protein